MYRRAVDAPLDRADNALRDVCRSARELLGLLPEKGRPSSRRRVETAALRSGTGGGGRARAELLDRLASDAVLVVANLTILIDGVADCFLIAASREGAVNIPSVSAILRPALEIAGQLVWLLTDAIHGEQRARRYLVWRLSDLRHQRHVLTDFRPNSDEDHRAQIELDSLERELLELAKSAKWNVRPTRVTPRGGAEAAVLLNKSGKAEAMPKISALVQLVSSTPSLYGLLSIPVHGRRFGMVHKLEVTSKRDRQGRVTFDVGGFGVPPGLGIGLACLAVDYPTRLLAGWNGVDSASLHQRVTDIVQSTRVQDG